MPVRVRNVIIRNISPFEITKATVASLWKHSFVQDTFVRNRTAFERFQRTVMGDMAKLSIKSWFEENGFRVTDWDDIRDSWRSRRKTFDLQINEHNIEVRSSISAYDNVRDVLINENIIQPCNVRVKEITIQAFYTNRRCQELWICGWTRREDLENPALRGPLRMGPRLVDFFRMPFNHQRAHTMNALLRYL